MRVVYKFGQFTMWGEIEESQVGKPVYMVHPIGRLTIQTKGEPDYTTTSTRRMEFDYAQRLDHDLVQYDFIQEDE